MTSEATPTPAPPTPSDDAQPRARLSFAAILPVLGLLLCATVFASAGEPQNLGPSLLSIITTLFHAFPVVAYLAGAVGLGMLLAPLTRGAHERRALETALGLGAMLTLSHALGWAGLLAGHKGSVIAWIPILAGIIALALSLRSPDSRRELRSFFSLWGVGFVAFSLIIVAACSPPGWLWDTEFGGFDVLVYHLQLPREWIELGSLQPLTHNVYSYLPSYLEAAFMHVGAISTFPGTAPNLLAIDGHPLLNCQLLHAGCCALAALITARFTARLLLNIGITGPRASAICMGAAAVVTTTPWVIVVSSIAYNEAAGLALLAGAMLAAAETSLGALRRGLLVGFLLAIAASVKPTIALVGAPAVAALILFDRRPREWFPIAAVAAITALAACAPWLTRNFMHGGNPVFPFATGLFGSAHWSADQVARYSLAHGFSGSWLDRILLIALPDAADPAGIRHRGMLHPQWGIFWVFLTPAAIALCFSRALRPVVLPMSLALIAQVVAWLSFTHIQSRFLIPAVIPAGVIIALAGERLAAWCCSRFNITDDSPRLVNSITQGPSILQFAVAALIFFSQHRGQPNHFLPRGVPGITGESERAKFEALTANAKNQFLNQIPVVHLWQLAPLERGTMYMFGESAVLYYHSPILYHSPWDESPLGKLVRMHPGDPAAWARGLRELGVVYFLVNAAEHNRLITINWYDPDASEANARLLANYCEPIIDFPEQATILFRLK